MKTQFKKLRPEATIPTRGTAFSAGFDMYSINNISVLPGEQVKIPTGIACAIPQGHAGFVWARSSVAVNYGVDVHAGLIDSDYRGEIHVCLINHGKNAFDILKGDRVAQMVVSPVLLESEEVGELSDPFTRSGGFGSTGV